MESNYNKKSRLLNTISTILAIIALLLMLVFIFSSCTKQYLTSEMLSYKVTGDGAYVSYYSNSDHSTHTVNVTDCGWTFQEAVQPGDSLEVLMFPAGYFNKSSIQVYFGTQLLYEGSPDSTVFISLKKKFYSEDFRLHKAP